MLKYWEEADLYRYGDDYDVLIFQKVYVGQDYDFPIMAKPIKILDICDPDWLENAYIVETVKAMQGVVVPTEPMKEFIDQFATCPVKVIKDRFDLDSFPEPKHHEGKLESLVWFGYSHNAEVLRFVIPTLERLKLKLTVISNQDPHCYRWGKDYKLYTYEKYDPETINERLQEHDAVLLPQGNRPQDRFKSDNKKDISRILGLPVIQNADDLSYYEKPENRNIRTDISKFDVKNSVKEYKEFINEIQAT